MKTYNLKAWDEFPECLQKINSKYGEYTINRKSYKNPILYRGQADSKWALETTLERFSKRTWTLYDYCREMFLCIPQLEQLTGKSWNLPEAESLEAILQSNSKTGFYIPPKFYELMVYLRHHNFPSPLLDWSESPYVATFFAFSEKVETKKAAVFAYISTTIGIKRGWEGEPMIRVMGPHTRGHARHFLQQSRYTISAVKEKDNKNYKFECHEKVFEKGSDRQDIIVKITIPISERMNVLTYLDRFNINHYSLMQSEEALIRMLAFRNIEIFEPLGK
jgi:hypothetical protein